MKRLSLILFLIFAAFANADEIGFTNQDGYSWTGSYWRWTDGTLWQRTARTYYDRYGCYRTQYQYHYVSNVVAAPVISYKSATWKEEAVKLLNEREDRNLFDKTMAALGQSSPVPQLGYGNSYLQRSHTIYGSGTTIYGAAVTAKDVWGDTSPAQLFQQLGNLTKNQQALSGEAVAAFGQLVGDDGVARARIAEIIANRDAAVAFLGALKTQQSVTKEYKIEPTQPGGIPSGAAAGQKLDPQTFEKRVSAQCASCHFGDKVQGNFNLGSLATMSNADKLKVWLRLNHTSPSKRMPQAATGGPGIPQTAQELEEWRQYLFAPMSAAKE